MSNVAAHWKWLAETFIVSCPMSKIDDQVLLARLKGQDVIIKDDDVAYFDPITGKFHCIGGTEKHVDFEQATVQQFDVEVVAKFWQYNQVIPKQVHTIRYTEEIDFQQVIDPKGTPTVGRSCS